jgi:hypothetical protein
MTERHGLEEQLDLVDDRVVVLAVPAITIKARSPRTVTTVS